MSSLPVANTQPIIEINENHEIFRSLCYSGINTTYTQKHTCLIHHIWYIYTHRYLYVCHIYTYTYIHVYDPFAHLNSPFPISGQTHMRYHPIQSIPYYFWYSAFITGISPPHNHLGNESWAQVSPPKYDISLEWQYLLGPILLTRIKENSVIEPILIKCTVGI